MVLEIKSLYVLKLVLLCFKSVYFDLYSLPNKLIHWSN